MTRRSTRSSSSVGPVPGAVYPTPTVAAPLTPTGPVPPELLTAPAIPLTNVTDDDGRLSVSVPSAWTDTDVGVQMNDDASDRPRVAAAPVLDEFYSDWEAPGVQVVAYPFTDDPSTLLHNLGYADQCTDGGVQSFSNGTFTGLMQTWTACGDTPRATCCWPSARPTSRSRCTSRSSFPTRTTRRCRPCCPRCGSGESLVVDTAFGSGAVALRTVLASFGQL